MTPTKNDAEQRPQQNRVERKEWVISYIKSEEMKNDFCETAFSAIEMEWQHRAERNSKSCQEEVSKLGFQSESR